MKIGRWQLKRAISKILETKNFGNFRWARNTWCRKKIEDAERLKPTRDKGSQKQDDTAYTSW